MFGKLINAKRLFLFAFICISFFTCGMTAQAAVSPLAIELGEAQEYGIGGENSFWDLQKSISVDFGNGEFFYSFGDRNTRLKYKGGEGGGFMDVGQLAKPDGQQVLQITPSLLAYNDTQYIKTGNFYILKTLTLGYYALYINDIQAAGTDWPYVNFTLYKLKGAPTKVASAPSVPATPSTAAQNSGGSFSPCGAPTVAERQHRTCGAVD